MRVQVDALYPDHMQLEPMFRVENELRDRGIEFVEDKPDLLLLHQYRRKPEYIAKQLDRGIPTVILERVASAHVQSRHEISRPNVVAVAKSTTFRDWRINNKPAVDGRYHVALLSDEAGKDRSPQLSVDDADKITLWYHFGFYAMMAPFIEADIDFDASRSIDAMFVGTCKYGSEALSRHRFQCVEQLNSGGRNVIASDTRELKRPDYIEAMFESSIAVSPWGLGEKCYRDFEGVYAGCVVIKPDTSHVLDITDTYRKTDGFIVICTPDFSNLNDWVTQILDNWDKMTECRRIARETMIAACTNRDVIATIVHNTFEEALARC